MKSKKKFKKYLEANENENTIIHNLWDGAKAVFRLKLIVIQAFLKRKILNKQCNPSPKVLQKEQQTKPKVSRTKEIIKIRAEKNKIRDSKILQKHRNQGLIPWKGKQNWQTCRSSPQRNKRRLKLSNERKKSQLIL